MSINDLTPTEFTTLVRNAAASKAAVAQNDKLGALGSSLTGKTIAMMFSKLSTRTRVSSEGAVALMGGHPMFLGKNDIQLGVRVPRASILPRDLFKRLTLAMPSTRSTSLSTTPRSSSPPWCRA